MRRVLLLVDDLMVRSRIEASAGAEVALHFARDAADFRAQLEPPPDLVLVGLAATRQPWAELLPEVRSRPETISIVAFGPHMDLDLRRRALEAGADRVLANSALMLALPELLRGEQM